MAWQQMQQYNRAPHPEAMNLASGETARAVQHTAPSSTNRREQRRMPTSHSNICPSPANSLGWRSKSRGNDARTSSCIETPAVCCERGRAESAVHFQGEFELVRVRNRCIYIFFVKFCSIKTLFSHFMLYSAHLLALIRDENRVSVSPKEDDVLAVGTRQGHLEALLGPTLSRGVRN